MDKVGYMSVYYAYHGEIIRDNITREGHGFMIKTNEPIFQLDNDEYTTCEDHRDLYDGGVMTYRVYVPKNWLDLWGWVATFAEELTAIRRASGLTVPAMAEKLSVPQRTLESWLAGDRNPTSKMQATVLTEAAGFIE